MSWVYPLVLLEVKSGGLRKSKGDFLIGQNADLRIHKESHILVICFMMFYREGQIAIDQVAHVMENKPW